MANRKKITDDEKIIIKGAREHNLKDIDLELPRNKLIVFSGVSGSGKSSLVFDTIYAEGQRRYVESLSSYARQFLERMSKPDVDLITGISPAVAIEQKTGSKNSRSTVGTTTEIYDYLRLLFARIGKTICYNCGKEVTKAGTGTVCDWLEDQEEGKKFYLAFPVSSSNGRKLSEELDLIKKRGFFRVFYKGKLVDLNDTDIKPRKTDDIFIVIQRFKIQPGKIREKLADAIEVTFKEGENRLAVIEADTGKRKDFNKLFECCGIRYEEPEPRFFSFNNPFGACPVCEGFSKVYGIDLDLVVPEPNRTILDGAIAPFRTPKFSKHARDLIREGKKKNFPIDVPFKNLKPEHIEFVKKGGGDYIGIDKFFEEMEKQTYKMHIRVYLSKYRGYRACHACKGSRLRREALQVMIADKSIFDVVQLPIKKTLQFFESLELNEFDAKVSERVLEETKKRLRFLNDVGLGYLTLDRLSFTLSGGETQRINLATALGSSLVGTLYVLDEPSIGLHPKDNDRLIKILKNLRDIGNSVLVVEHDPAMIKEADLVVDMGPRAGSHGGEITAKGTVSEVKKDKNSLTGKYLNGSLSIPLPEVRRKGNGNYISVKGASENNLKNVDVSIPLNQLVVVTGVSGSGKSTLIHDVLYGALALKLGSKPSHIGKFTELKGSEHIDAVEIVDQSPIGKSPRSNPVSYMKAYEHIRELFASTHQSKVRGYKPGFFSFNVPGGRCETCQGDGFIKVEMQFLADIYLECEECKGTRFKRELREVMYRNKNIVDVLNMTVDEAIPYFAGKVKIVNALQLLSDVGMGYIKLGQPSNTLSGGEAQRVKLASHLNNRREKDHTLFIFDEPTTGLHFDDIAKLLQSFEMLLKSNNSVVIIEHNLEIIKCADTIIDLGPGAGDEGGKVVAIGTPEEIAADKNSATGQFLKEYFTN